MAPTLSNALRVIYGDISRVRTFEGLFNILCFRGVFYGSDYAREDLKWLDGYDGWMATREGYSGRKGSNYFVNKSAYGFVSHQRSVSLIDNDYRRLQASKRAQWSLMIDNQSSSRDVFDFLRSIDNIGLLTPLLIVGDLAQANIISQPTVEDMAYFIHNEDWRAVGAMQHLGIISSNPDEHDIVIALSDLNQSITNEFTQDELNQMGYDLVTLEHGLCQFTRLMDRKSSNRRI
jgi:hypothetical protein